MRALIGLFFLFLVSGISPAFASLPDSPNYDVDLQTIDSGGSPADSANYNMLFQGISSMATPVSTGGDRQLVTGPHFSSKVSTVSGFNPLEALGVTLSATVEGLYTTQVKFQIRLSDSSIVDVLPLAIDSDGDDGFELSWDSKQTISTTDRVEVLARAYDGLTWGPLMDIGLEFAVNQIPANINFLTLQHAAFSPNGPTSVGIKDSLDIDFQVASPNYEWTIDISQSGTLVRTYSGSASQLESQINWDGTDSAPDFVSDGTYDVVLTIVDDIDRVNSENTTVIVDNTAPNSLAVSASATGTVARNTSQGLLDSTWSGTDVVDASLTYDVEIGVFPFGNDDYSTYLTDTDLLSFDDVLVADHSMFNVRVTAIDDAGNQTQFTSASTYSPDRTAPVIDAEFDEIRGTEDINISYNATAHKSDNASSGADLVWTYDIVTNGQDSLYHTEDIIQSTAVRVDGDQDYFDMTLFANRNTDDTSNGNQYGVDRAKISVTLTDAELNTASTDIELDIIPVNDAPIFTDDVNSANVVKDGFDRLLHSFFALEDSDTTGQIIDLDDYVSDIDNDLADLTFTISGAADPSSQNYFQEVSASVLAAVDTFDVVYESSGMYIGIGDAGSGHDLYFQPKSDFYGDQIITINVSDSALLPEPSLDSNPLRFRVWPVNDAPQPLSLTSNITLLEDHDKVLSIAGNKSDIEDESSDVIWTIASFDTVLIDTVSLAGDVLTITPKDNSYGTSNVTLRLTDTDALDPFSIYSSAPYDGYISNPQSTTVSITVVWQPVNDAPVITGVIPNISGTEDVALSGFDLSVYESDSEDTDGANQLSWSVSVDDDDILTASINNSDPNKPITLTITPNGFGTANVTLTLTDSDDQIAFAPYIASPKSDSQVIQVSLSSVNDVPALSSAPLTSVNGNRSDLVMMGDSLQITPLGYTDVGYTADNRDSGVPGDEYTSLNTKQYQYVWTVDGSVTRNVVLTNTSNILSVPTGTEGQVIVASAYPHDSVVTGSVVTNSIKINTQPSAVNLIAPLFDDYINTRNLTISWDSATDTDDNDPVYHRLKVWKLASASSPPPVLDVSASVDFDSGWVSNNYVQFTSSEDAHSFLDGTYYWAVFSGNKFNTTLFDYEQPISSRKFTIDTIPPTSPDADNVVYVDAITSGQDLLEGGNCRILYGDKPEVIPDGEDYRIYMTYTNTVTIGESPVVSTGSIELVSVSDSDNWTYGICFPTGTTVYNMFVEDRAQNRSQFHTFTITEDTIPPTVPVINGVEDGGLALISSGNRVIVSGTKEADSALFYDGIEIVGFTPVTDFTMILYPTKPSGRLTSKDRSGNESDGIDVVVSFLQGSPTLNLQSVSRTVINSSENVRLLPVLTSLSKQDDFNDVTRSTVRWSSNRDLESYSVKIGATVFDAGGAVPSHTVQSTIIPGNSSLLAEGGNTVTIIGVDKANNSAQVSQDISLLTATPNTFIINQFTVQVLQGAYKVTINGDQPDNQTVMINDSTSNVTVLNNGFWEYLDTDFDLETDDIVITLRDDAFNQSSRLVWDNANFASFSNPEDISPTALTSALLYYDPLPVTISGVYSHEFVADTQAQLLGFSATEQHRLQDWVFKQDGLATSSSLSSHLVQIYMRKKSGYYMVSDRLESMTIQVMIPIADDQDPATLRPVYFDSRTGMWEQRHLPLSVSKDGQFMIVSIDQLGIWALAEEVTFAARPSDSRVYPNPWVPGDGNSDTGDDSGIRFDQLPENARIRIFTISGRKVMDSRPGTASWTWDGRNESASDVSSGVYLYIISASGESKSGKLTIIR